MIVCNRSCQPYDTANMHFGGAAAAQGSNNAAPPHMRHKADGSADLPRTYLMVAIYTSPNDARLRQACFSFFSN